MSMAVVIAPPTDPPIPIARIGTKPMAASACREVHRLAAKSHLHGLAEGEDGKDGKRREDDPHHHHDDHA